MEDQFLRKIDVLDKGFVRLVKYMASDADVVQAARVSYGAGTKTVSEDRGLIRYLVRHRHTTPLEMCEFKFHIKIPMDSWRQMVRHRTACLSGETELWFDEPAAANGGFRKRSKKTIEDLYDQWHNGAKPIPHRKIIKLKEMENNIEKEKIYSVPELSSASGYREESIRWAIREHKIKHQIVNSKQNEPSIYLYGNDWVEYCEKIPNLHIPLKDRVSSRYLRMVNEETQEIQHTHITDIWKTGTKPVYEVELENGQKLKMTKDHLCYTNNGWLKLKDAVDLKLCDTTNDIISWSGKALFAANGLPTYQNKEWLEYHKSKPLSKREIGELAGVSGATIKKWMTHFGIKYTSKEKGKLTSKSQVGIKNPRKGRKGPLSPDALMAIKKARSGENSNFWRGGITDKHSRGGEYSAWIVGAKKRLLKKYNYKCAITGTNKNLEAHHVVPVWMDKLKEREESNLILLCRTAHRAIHSNNLEGVFIEWVNSGRNLVDFFEKNDVKLDFNKKRRKRKKSLKLAIDFIKVKNVKFIGEEMTYDLSVSGPFHNFIANGFVVHNSVNEYSTRYSVAINDKQQTSHDQWRLQAKNNKQGSSGVIEDVEKGVWLTGREEELHKLAEEVYQERLDAGVAREQARKDLPLSNYTEAYWKVDLHNLLHYLKLRMDSHAQYEIRQYANAIYELIKPVVPLVCEAFEDYVLNAHTFSAQEMKVIRYFVGVAVDFEDYVRNNGSWFTEKGKPTRELKELRAKLNLSTKTTNK